MKAAPFDLVRAETVDEVVGLLAGDDGSQVLSGGQSLLPLLAMRQVRPRVLIDVNGLRLDHVDLPAPDGLRLGALVRHRRLERDALVASVAPLLSEAAGLIGYPSVRNQGTLGGSLAHAHPAAELPAALLALGASVVAVGPGGRRRVDIADLYLDRFSTSLRPDELIVEVEVPVAASRQGAAFCEWAPRTSDFALAGVAVVVRCDNAGSVVLARAAACGVAEVPLDLTDAVSSLIGVSRPGDGLLRTLASSVRTACAGDDDKGRLTALLAARAAWRAMERAAGGSDAEDEDPPAVRPTDARPVSGGFPNGSRIPRQRHGTLRRVPFTVNDQPAEVVVAGRTTLLDALRESLGLTSVHAGCEYGACGACTVLLDGASVRSCLVLAAQVDGRSVTTVEGLGTRDALHPLMDAFRRNHALQCGFCTPAMVLSATELLADEPHPTEGEVRVGLSGNLCRCTGYTGIIDGVLDASRTDAGEDS